MILDSKTPWNIGRIVDCLHCLDWGFFLIPDPILHFSPWKWGTFLSETTIASFSVIWLASCETFYVSGAMYWTRVQTPESYDSKVYIPSITETDYCIFSYSFCPWIVSLLEYFLHQKFSLWCKKLKYCRKYLNLFHSNIYYKICVLCRISWLPTHHI